MNKKVTVDDLAKEISQSLKDFEGVTDEACAAGVMYTAEEAVKKLRVAHPSGSGEYGSWDKYNRDWGIFQTKTDKKNHIKATVHNKEHYRLTHLLEKGHALIGGGRTRAFPHILPVAKEAEDELVENIKKRIENG